MAHAAERDGMVRDEKTRETEGERTRKHVLSVNDRFAWLIPSRITTVFPETRRNKLKHAIT